MSKIIRAGVLGATGYVGRELLRILSLHPSVSLEILTAHSHVGRDVSEVHPSLSRVVGGRFRGLEGEEGSIVREAERHVVSWSELAELDIVFSALPHRQSARPIQSILAAKHAHARSVRIIDLGADLRLSAEQYRTWYGEQHPSPELLENVVYGIPELFRDEIRTAEIVACGGCFAHCSILSLAPLALAERLTGVIRISAVTGSSGSGAQPIARTHHPERANSMSVYDSLPHRHTVEIENTIATIQSPRPLLFVPSSGPFTRGIFATVFPTMNDRTGIMDLYQEFSERNPFVRFRRTSPRLIDVVGTNFFDCTVIELQGETVIVGALDNLGKGAASNAVHSMNLMCDLPETTGLLFGSVAP